ncbi:MAG: hypothetical protein H7A24_05765 [Leptospiraceae bacterium]|nr:hypothetical protein [Leptospiraceae bacterium]MCP5511366.1 hypothetical protein [Leptospiraceae bacterium]
MLKKFKSFLGNLKTKFTVPEEEETIQRQARPLGFERELEELRKKLSDFLLTSKVNSGIVVERNGYKLLKNGPNLYKLEGKEKEGRAFSIAISTGSFLNVGEEKVTGILQVEEAELNRAIQTDHSQLISFLGKFKTLELNDRALEGLTGIRNRYHWKEILLWERFWKEQVVIRLSPNCLALLLVIHDDSFKKFFLEVASRKTKKIVYDELFYLNQGVNSEESNPNTKNYDLPSFERAKLDLRRVIEQVRKKRDQ